MDRTIDANDVFLYLENFSIALKKSPVTYMHGKIFPYIESFLLNLYFDE